MHKDHTKERNSKRVDPTEEHAEDRYASGSDSFDGVSFSPFEHPMKPLEQQLSGQRA